MDHLGLQTVAMGGISLGAAISLRLAVTHPQRVKALALLARRGFAIPEGYLNRDWTQPYEANEEVEAAWLAVYRDALRALLA